ncbi:MAG: NAD(P)-dependent oxidoreductase [Turicibacter sp.]|nr:NAD(P)-dependent oxidoreductase [Turicibacter sp.]
MKIGFIGTGVMGQAMARNIILNANYELYVYNRTKSKANELVHLGAIWCDDVKTVANSCDLIFTIIGVPTDVEEVYLGENGLVNHAKSHTILVDMATSTPDLAKRIYKAGKEKVIYCLDAPVTGGDVGAKNGTLTMMVGGDKEIYDKVLPILQLMGKTTVYMGEAGSGQHTKMANQIAISGAVIGMAEALAYSKGAGLDLKTMLEVITSGSAASWQLSNMAPRVVNEDFSPGFFIKHFIKDMRIALNESKLMNVALPGLELVLSLYEQCQKQGFENDGTQALYKLYDKDLK